MRTTLRAIVSIAAAVAPAAAAAQGVTVQRVTDLRFSGALGTIVNIAAKLGGGDMHNIPGTTYLSGHKLRTESGDHATIIDADAGRYISIDNKQKTYTSMTFEQMAAAIRAATDSAQAHVKQQGNQKSADERNGEVDLKYNFAVDKSSERQKIAGYDVERSFYTITLEADAKPQNGQAEQSGAMVFLVDQWTSRDAPQAQAMREFQKAYMEKAGQAYRSSLDALRSAFASDPRIKTGLEATAKEMQKVDGIPLRSTTYVVLVPAGMQFNRALALGDASSQADAKPKGGGFKGLIGKVKAAAEEANKQPSDKAVAPTQATLITMSDEVRSVTTGALSPDLFAPPAGYREVTPRQP